MNKNLDRYISASILCDVSWEREEHFRNTTVFWFSLYVWFVMIGIAKGGGGQRRLKGKSIYVRFRKTMKKIMKNWILWILVFKSWTGVLSFLSPAEGKKKLSFIYFGNLMLQNIQAHGKFPDSYIFQNIITVRACTLFH